MAGVSIRRSIRWLPQDASEPTSTVVLSSAEKRFVDIRILKSKDNETIDQNETLPLQRLDWAIAGTSTSVAVSDRGPEVKLTTFHHWVDSRTVDLESAKDEGYMSPMGTDGPDEIVLEVGNMVNPDSGLLTDYEEVWIERESESVLGDERSQIVALDYDEGVEHRGRIIRVGKLCQGLLRIKNEVTAERWEWMEGKGWLRSILVGHDGALPCKQILKSLDSGSIEHNGRTWTVVERS